MRLLKLILIAGLSFSCLNAEAGKKDKKEKVKKEQKHTAKKKHKKAGLEDTYWRLSDLSNITVTSGNNEPHIFLHKGKLTGNTGCNDITGKFNKSNRFDGLKFEAATTEMGCMTGMDTEKLMLKVLSETTKYKQNGNNLLLYNGTILLAIFEAKDL